MGKIRAQKKGKSRRFRVPKRRSKISPEYMEGEGKIIDIIHSIGRPLIKVEMDGKKIFMIAPENVGVGDEIEVGKNAKPETGNVLALKDIPEGMPIFNVERRVGDGGSMIRSSGGSGIIVSKGKKCVVKFPSKKTNELNPNCRATIGVVAGGGRTDKPIIKAGIKHKMMKAKGKQYPVTSGTAMNPVDHPFGGKTSPGIPKSSSRNAPPGKKVGSISSKRTGKKKR